MSSESTNGHRSILPLNPLDTLDERCPSRLTLEILEAIDISIEHYKNNIYTVVFPDTLEHGDPIGNRYGVLLHVSSIVVNTSSHECYKFKD